MRAMHNGAPGRRPAATRGLGRGILVAALAATALSAAAQVGGPTGTRTTGAGTTGATVAGARTSEAVTAAATTGATSGAATSGTAVANRFALGDELSLEQCFAASLVGSRDLLLARTRLQQAEAQLLSGWSAVKPTINFGAEVRRNDQEEFAEIEDGVLIPIQTLWDHNARATVSQPVINLQAIPALSALRAQRRATWYDNARSRTNVLFSVATVFYQGLALQDAVRLALRQLEVTSRQLEVTRARYEVGEVSKVDVLRAEIDRSTAEQDLVAARARLAATKLALAILVGRPEDAGDFSLLRPEEPELPEGVDTVERALAARPDLVAAAWRVESARHAVTARTLAYVPTVDASWTAFYQRADTPFSPDAFRWWGLLTLTWTPYAAGRNRAEIQQANIQRRQAELARDGLADTIRQQVREAELELRTAAANLTSAEATARLAQENADLIDARYKAGLATSLDVTDATARLFGAEVEVLRLRLDREVALLALARAVGIFDEVAGVPSPPGGAIVPPAPAEVELPKPADEEPEPAAGEPAPASEAR